MASEVFSVLLKASIAFTVLYTVYLCLFRNTTFHQVNRIYLLFVIIFSLVVPYLDFDYFLASKAHLNIDSWLNAIPDSDIGFFEDAAEQTVGSTHGNSFIFWLFCFYIVVVMVLLLRFLKGLLVLRHLKVQAAKETYMGRNVYRSKNCKAPFTFFTDIFIPEHFHAQKGTELVLQHEWAHANQLHTLDVFLAELYGIVFWFNPFVILHKRSLKTVHEYLADSAVARSKNDKITYMQLLVQTVSYKPYNRLSSNFYWLTLKKRINMITKNKTSKFRLFTYLLILPVLAIVIQSFSMSQINTANAEATYGNAPCMMPIKEKDLDKIASGFGMRMHPIKKVEMMHNGVDMAAKKGTPVMATADGRVVKVEFKGEGIGYGRAIVIQHDNTFSTLYAQLSEFKVNAGEKVKQGQVIGLVGSSGMSTGAHLHYEVRKNGEPVDPGNYFNKK